MSADDTSNLEGPGGAFIALLAIISAQNLLATNMMLPALPAITYELGASAAEAQLTLILFFAVYAGSLLLYGPLSDGLGRRPVLFCSLFIYCLGSLVCAVSDSITVLIWGRILQALGAGGSTIIAWAVARDLFDGPNLLRVTSLINAGRSAIPAIAPTFGGLFVELAGWRASFAATFVVGGVTFVLGALLITETLRRGGENNPLMTAAIAYRSVLTSNGFVRFGAAGACALGPWFTFIAASPSVLMRELGLSPSQYGIYASLMVSGTIAGGILTAWKSGAVGWRVLTKLGLGALFGGSVTMLALPAVGVVAISGVVIPMFFVSLGSGAIFPIATARAMQISGDRAGTAFALVGSMSMVVAAFSAALVTDLSGDLIFVVPLIMTAWALCSIMTLFRL